MSESTSTTMPYANSDGDPFAALGALSARVIDNTTVEIPANVRAVFASEVTYFSNQPNTAKRELTMPSEADADKLRAQLKSYAREHKLNLGLPVEDKFGRKLNAGVLVTYRLTQKSDKSDVDTTTVTVTNVADADDSETDRQMEASAAESE